MKHMRMLRFPGLLLQLVMAVCSAHGQAPLPGEVVHLDIKGLPVAGIRALAKDNDGALWIGTENGLCRYDGLNVDVYRNIPGDSTSIPGNYVQDLVLDGEGRMWASCFGGVCVFDPHLDWRTRGPVFERKPLLTRNGGFPIYEATDLFIDHEGGIWLSCVINGLAKYDAPTGIFREVLELREALAHGANSPNVLGMTCDTTGIVWVVSRMSLYRFDPKAGSTRRYPFELPGDLERQGALLARVTQDANNANTLWLGTWGLGLVRFDKRTGGFENYTISQGGPVNLTNIVWSVLPQRDGRILVGIEKGLHWFDPRSRAFSKTFGTFDWKSGVFEANANTLMQEADGRIWIGSYDGLHVLPARSSEFDQWPTLAQNLCVATDHPGYWAASMYARRRLFKLGPSGEVLDSLPIPHADEERAEPISILQTQDGRVLIGTTRGLVIFHPKARSFASEWFEDVVADVHRPGIHSIVEAPDGSVWMAFNGRGLLHFRPGEKAELVEPTPRVGDNSPRHVWRSVSRFDEHHLALTDERAGVGVVDTRMMRLVHLTNYGHQDKELVNITALVASSSSTLHVVTLNEGIVELRFDGDSLHYVTTHKDVVAGENGYTDAAADTLGNIWIGTSTGLVRFNTVDRSFQHIGAIDGLGMSSVASVLRDSDGYMLASHMISARFNASTFPPQADVSGLYFRTITVNGTVQNTAEGGSAETLLALSHDRNSITIAYAPISMLHADVLRYEVMLDGHDEHWVDNGYQRTASYIGLPPGEYAFKVRVRGDATNIATTIPFTIIPAFWQTWWFRAIAVLLSGALIFLLSRYILALRYRQRIAALEREREIGAVRTRIARDIHDDLGSGLTRITMLSRAMSSSKENVQDKEHLAGSIAEASTELIGQLSEIVWTVDPKNDHAEHFIAYVRDLLGRQFEELPVALRTDLGIEPGMERRDIPPAVKRNAVMILKETVSNALKHAQARTITIKLQISAGELRLHVQDDGRGFDLPANNPRGNGLGNLRKRSEAMGGAMHVESDATGTRYALIVPLPTPTIMRGE